MERVSDPKTYYRELILHHSKDARFYGPLPGANVHATRHNALCGDTIVLHLEVDEGRVLRASFEGYSCAIARAVASRMAERVTGEAIAEVLAWAVRVEAAVRGHDAEFGFEEVCGIASLPARRRCATLPWEALAAALAEDGAPTPSAS